MKGTRSACRLVSALLVRWGASLVCPRRRWYPHCLAHMRRQLRDLPGTFDIAVYAHTHKPHVDRDEQGRLWINPGETSGWTYGRPSVALLDTTTRQAEILWLATEERKFDG